ncbi:hypothetical protein F5Y14DRAFT_447663 [Nemania sp. NC0429]|nr:hypothetical protein F5Y14DRAFT_447663 [Nemania sp. NC0429]
MKHASRTPNVKHALQMSNGNHSLTTPNGAIPVPPLAKALSHAASLTVHNISTSAQSVILYPVPPIFSPNHTPEEVRYSIFQASRAIKPGSGSITFPLHCGPPPNSGTDISPGIIGIAGSTSKQATARTKLFPTDWTLLFPPGNSGSPAQNVCMMTMPHGSEARFLTSDELKANNVTETSNADPGTITIRTDTTFASNDGVHPFVGICALSQLFPNYLVPIITWDAAPNWVYI